MLINGYIFTIFDEYSFISKLIISEERVCYFANKIYNTGSSVFTGEAKSPASPTWQDEKFL